MAFNVTFPEGSLPTTDLTFRAIQDGCHCHVPIETQQKWLQFNQFNKYCIEFTFDRVVANCQSQKILSRYFTRVCE